MKILDNDSTYIQMKRNRNGMCINESNLSCSYSHIMVINTINIFGLGNGYDNTVLEKKCESTHFFFNLFNGFFQYDFGGRGENENNHS